jgi:ABC-type bacteriocin/lantibiotic exporter with double-glycine peptidase domain
VIDKPLEESGTLEIQQRNIPGLEVETRNLSFYYEPGNNVLENINLKIESGQKVAIMGSDGSGKSTLLKILTGAYQPTEGLLLINKIPLVNYNINNLRSYMGIYFSHHDIFQGTLMENITMGNPGIQWNEVVDIAGKLGFDDFISNLPGGLDHHIDPIGKKLSKNSIQKILLLRMLMMQPRLLLMEEPWQSIEEKYKVKIEDYLLNQKDTTLIMITNDQSFADRCDQVIYLKNGRIININNPKI